MGWPACMALGCDNWPAVGDILLCAECAKDPKLIDAEWKRLYELYRKEADDLRAQLAAVTAEWGDAARVHEEVRRNWGHALDRARHAEAERDAAIKERDEARKEVADWLEVYPRINKNMLAMGQMRGDAIARAEAAEAQTAYVDETVRQTQEATDAWRERAEAAERVVEASEKDIERAEVVIMTTSVCGSLEADYLAEQFAQVRADERASMQLECEAAHLAAEERGRAEERAAIVAWLREEVRLGMRSYAKVADAIEAAEHEEGT